MIFIGSHLLGEQVAKGSRACFCPLCRFAAILPGECSPLSMPSLVRSGFRLWLHNLWGTRIRSEWYGTLPSFEEISPQERSKKRNNQNECQC
jgi:hypothetical protein